jgi:hypothetical protein
MEHQGIAKSGLVWRTRWGIVTDGSIWLFQEWMEKINVGEVIKETSMHFVN